MMGRLPYVSLDRFLLLGRGGERRLLPATAVTFGGAETRVRPSVVRHSKKLKHVARSRCHASFLGACATPSGRLAAGPPPAAAARCCRPQPDGPTCSSLTPRSEAPQKARRSLCDALLLRKPGRAPKGTRLESGSRLQRAVRQGCDLIVNFVRVPLHSGQWSHSRSSPTDVAEGAPHDAITTVAANPLYCEVTPRKLLEPPCQGELPQ